MNKKYFFLLILTVFMCGTVAFGQKSIVILHTNDTHSRIEPIPESDRIAGNKGGVVRRMNYIEQVRKENKNVLLFDAGDFLQGTPYFNLFKGEVETEAMNMMRYDAVTLGNHEFDYGLEALEKVVRRAKFPIISSNYDFSGTPLNNLIKPYLIFKKDGVKIGVIAINIQPKGLIASGNYDGMKFLQPERVANELALKKYGPKQIAQKSIKHLKILAANLQNLPDDLTVLLEKIKDDKLKVNFEVEGLEDMRKTLQNASNRLTYAIIIAALSIGSSILMMAHIPPLFFGNSFLGLLGFIISGILGITIIYSIWKKDK